MAGVVSKHANNEDKDRITALPDEVRSHILSFLPTKDAVMTSFLSKGWKSTWTSLTKLELDDSKVVQFENFAVRVMSLHQASIKQFTIRCHDWHNPELIQPWISTAVMRNVSELNIRLSFENMKLPDCVYSCESLEVLKLCGWITLEVPNNVVSLKRLKSISFCWLEVKDDSYMPILLSGCPVIEDLHICKPMWETLSTFSVCSTSLKRLWVDIESRSFAPKDCSFFLDAPNLEFLEIINNVMPLTEKNFEKQASSLVSASIDLGNSVSPVRVVVKLLNHMSSTINRLSLSFSTLQPIGEANHETQLAVFNNLKYLRLEVETNAASHYWSVVHCFLERSPNLTSLVLVGKGPASYSEWHQPDGVAECLMLNLEILKVHGLDGGEGEMELIEYFLRNAMVLKEMALCSRVLPAEEKESLLQRCSTFAWGSSTCQLTFC